MRLLALTTYIPGQNAQTEVHVIVVQANVNAFLATKVLRARELYAPTTVMTEEPAGLKNIWQTKPIAPMLSHGML